MGGQEAVDQVGAVLDLLELALDDADQAVQVGRGEVDDGPLEQRPDALDRFATVHASLDRRVANRRLSPALYTIDEAGKVVPYNRPESDVLATKAKMRT